MKKLIIAFLLITPLFCALSCARPAGEYRKISAEEAYQMMSSLENFILLDVRSEAEHNQKYIAGSVLIPNDEIGERAMGERAMGERAVKELPDKRSVIFVYCASGGRSETASKKLIGMGYLNVYDFGGINKWPYETLPAE